MNPALQRIRIHQRNMLPDLVKLETSQLGRPWHKLPKLMNDSFDILDSRLSIYFLKKLRVNAALKSMTFSLDRHCKNALIFATCYGNIAFVIDRILLLNILHDYYGLSKESNLATPDTRTAVTKTEERLRNKLGLELTALIINKETFGEDLEIKNDYSTVKSQWAWCVTFTLEGYDHGAFSILLDSPHVDRMLSALRSPDAVTSSPQPQLEALFETLPLRLSGRLASLSLTVAQLADVKPGDIIPITMSDPVPVFIGKEQIFDATIAEDRGRLFLCDLHDKTTEKSYE